MRINHLMYADDIVLFCPSAKGLQELINCCVYEGNKLDLRFNENKTVYMTALSTFDCHCKNQLPDIYINDKALSLVDTYKYLGHYISNNLVDDKDILRQVQANYAKGNMLCDKFSDSSSEVKGVLFKLTCILCILCHFGVTTQTLPTENLLFLTITYLECCLSNQCTAVLPTCL